MVEGVPKRKRELQDFGNPDAKQETAFPCSIEKATREESRDP